MGVVGREINTIIFMFCGPSLKSISHLFPSATVITELNKDDEKRR